MAKSKLPRRSGSSLEAVEPNPQKEAIKVKVKKGINKGFLKDHGRSHSIAFC